MKRINNKYLIYGSVFIALSVILFLFLYFKGRAPEYLFSTTKVERGSIYNTVTATGTLEATNTVEVGTQVSGVIQKLYVDFNSEVKKGQLIAELDKATLQSSLENAEADLEKAIANFEYQESLLARNKVLYEKGLLAKGDYDLVLFNYKTSKAEVKSAKANLSKAERNLGYASIYSPIDGVVLNRAVEEGQTVAASMSTPELYTITNDLSTMEVEANIDEADIGQLEVGQRVEFTVDAFPDLTFKGNISEIRLQPTEESNVITYTTIITVSNPDLKLKPGMTASIVIYVEEANDVLIVKEKATSFTPDPQLLKDYMSRISENDMKPQSGKSLDEGDRAPGSHPGERLEADDTHKLVWLKEDALIRPVVIEVGISDGSNIEILSGLEEGDSIVTSFELADNSASIKKSNPDGDQKSPFVQENSRPGGGGGPSGPPR